MKPKTLKTITKNKKAVIWTIKRPGAEYTAVIKTAEMGFVQATIHIPPYTMDTFYLCAAKAGLQDVLLDAFTLDEAMVEAVKRILG